MVFRQRLTSSAFSFLLTTLASGVVVTLGLPVCAAVVSTPEPLQQQDSSSPDRTLILRRAIIGQESGANFRAINPHSGALGYAQVMPANLPAWSIEAVGFPVSRDRFLNDPELQLAIIDYKLNQYWQRSLWASGGDETLAILRVAAWWYSGKPDRYTSNQPQFYRGHRYPSIAAYSLAVLQRYQDLLVEIENTALSSDRPVTNQPLLNQQQQLTPRT